MATLSQIPSVFFFLVPTCIAPRSCSGVEITWHRSIVVIGQQVNFTFSDFVSLVVIEVANPIDSSFGRQLYGVYISLLFMGRTLVDVLQMPLGPTPVPSYGCLMTPITYSRVTTLRCWIEGLDHYLGLLFSL